MEEQDKAKFEYTYRAPTTEERRQIEEIRRFYGTDGGRREKYARLKKLDKRVKDTAAVCALGLGVAGCLLFGLGMSMILAWDILGGGIAVSALGIVPIVLANPMYNFILKRNKAKYGPEILRLSEELLNEKK